MRCPKCHYLSFDPEPRCKNCGYGLSLDEDDLLIRDEDVPASPFTDIPLRPAAVTSAPPRSVLPVAPAQAPPPRATPPFAALGEPAAPANTGDLTPAERAAVSQLPPSPGRPRSAPTTELPLFVKGMSGGGAAQARLIDEPLLQLSEEPRPPLSVRRKVQDPPMPKPARFAPAQEPKIVGPLDRDLLGDLHRNDGASEVETRSPRGAQVASTVSPVGAAPRLAAATIDGALLGSLSVAVMWLTLRWCGLPLDRALMLPVLIPTSVFLSLLGVGYLVMFNAAGGQTIGKMVLGLRVVREVTLFDAGGPVSFGQAVLRAVLTLPSVLVAGVGFLPALVGEKRAVHDRLAHTRVIRA